MIFLYSLVKFLYFDKFSWWPQNDGWPTPHVIQLWRVADEQQGFLAEEEPPVIRAWQLGSAVSHPAPDVGWTSSVDEMNFIAWIFQFGGKQYVQLNWSVYVIQLQCILGVFNTASAYSPIWCIQFTASIYSIFNSSVYTVRIQCIKYSVHEYSIHVRSIQCLEFSVYGIQLKKLRCMHLIIQFAEKYSISTGNTQNSAQ